MRFPHRADRFRLAPLVYCLLILLTFFGLVVHARAREVTDDVQAGSLRLRGEQGDLLPAPQVHTAVRMEITGIIARVEVEQRFRNPSAVWTEGTYAFPLPENSAVDRLYMQIGERIVEGEIREKVQAQRLYEQARANGQRASVVHQQRPNLFRTAVANIGPGETIVVRMGYLQIIEQNAGHYSVRFPLTITPRYVPGIAPDQPLTLETPTAAATSAVSNDDTSSLGDLHPMLAQPDVDRQSVTFDIDLDAGATLQNIESRYHSIAVSQDGAHAKIRLQDAHVPPDHDFVLAWTPAVRGEPAVALYQEPTDAGNHVLLMLLPPHHETHLTTPRDVVFIIDTSGSMSGASIEQARVALLKGLDTLTSRDRFTIIEFNSDYHVLFSQPVQATPQQVETARRFVRNLEADGGTEMYPALLAALSMPIDREYLRQVIFITDGAIGNEDQLMQMIRERLGGARLFTVGIGSAPNAYFMRTAARMGRGTFTYIGSTDEVDRRMSELLEKLTKPVMTNISLQWPNAIQPEYAPDQLTDLYAGEPIVIAARVPDEVQGVLTISGKTRSIWTRHIVLDSAQHRAGIATLWARNRIADLMEQRASGVPDTELRAQVLPLALQYRVVSNYTSLIAVDRTPARALEDPLHTSRVANTKPSGLAWDVPAYPKTGTSAGLQMMVGVALMFVALGWWCAMNGCFAAALTRRFRVDLSRNRER